MKKNALIVLLFLFAGTARASNFDEAKVGVCYRAVMESFIKYTSHGRDGYSEEYRADYDKMASRWLLGCYVEKLEFSDEAAPKVIFKKFPSINEMARRCNYFGAGFYFGTSDYQIKPVALRAAEATRNNPLCDGVFK